MSEWRYWLDNGDQLVAILERKTRPRIGSVVTHEGQKWEVWYVEEGAGVRNARCEPLVTLTVPSR